MIIIISLASIQLMTRGHGTPQSVSIWILPYEYSMNWRQVRCVLLLYCAGSVMRVPHVLPQCSYWYITGIFNFTSSSVFHVCLTCCLTATEQYIIYSCYQVKSAEA